MPDQRNDLNHVMRNGLEVVRHMLRQVDHRLDGMERDLIQITSPQDPKIKLLVVRLEDHKEGSLGVLLYDRRLFCFTLERDSKDPDKPRIPAGVYKLKHFSGYTYKNTLEIIVPGHEYVLFHSGNIEAHTEMCVLMARDPGYLLVKGKKIRAILDSRTVFKKFKAEIVPLIEDGDKVEFINFYV